jgi:hypothetical protein
MFPFFIKLTEEDTRIMIAVFIIVLLIFIIISYIGLLINKIMKRQAKDLDTAMHDVVSTGVVDTPRYFRRIATKKNHRLLFKQVRIPFLFLFVSVSFLVIYLTWIENYDLTFLWDYQYKGINTLFFIFDWPNQPHALFYGINLPSGWPPVLNTPHLELEAWPSYVFAPLFSVGAVWLLVAIQAYVARTWRLLVMSKAVFQKNLETVVPGSDFKRKEK